MKVIDLTRDFVRSKETGFSDSTAVQRPCGRDRRDASHFATTTTYVIDFISVPIVPIGERRTEPNVGYIAEHSVCGDILIITPPDWRTEQRRRGGPAVRPGTPHERV